MSGSHKRTIAKNSVFLYLRMFVVLILGLYISRILLNELGTVDYGIYGVVGSLVTLFSFFNSAMVTAGQRCLSFELGLKQKGSFEKMLGTIIVFTGITSVIIFILLQVGGIYFLETLNIPSNRFNAAKEVFRFSCLSFFLTSMQIPFSSSLMAQEKINIFSFISVIDVVLKLSIVVVLQFTKNDKLIMYSIFLIISNLIVFGLYAITGLKNVKVSFVISKYQVSTISKYFGWNLLGGMASISLHQGLQIVLNLFFNPLINAAQTIAFQIKSGLESFASNIRSASNPQIIKLAAGRKEADMLEILSLSMRFSSIAILLITIPLYIKIDYILELWLVEPPKLSSIFIKLYIINAIIDVVSSPIVTVIQAVGDIKRYQIIASSLLLLILPVVSLFYKLGFPPQVYGYVFIIVTSLLVLIRLLFLLKLINVPRRMILYSVFKQIVILPVIAFITPFLIANLLEDNLVNLFLTFVISFISVTTFTWILLFDREEKKKFLILIKSKLYM